MFCFSPSSCLSENKVEPVVSDMWEGLQKAPSAAGQGAAILPLYRDVTPVLI